MPKTSTLERQSENESSCSDRDQTNVSVCDLDVSRVDNPTISRLIEEVRNREIESTHAYNRTYNRHNR